MTKISKVALSLKMPTSMINEVNASDCNKDALLQAVEKLSNHTLNTEPFIQQHIISRNDAHTMRALLEREFKHALIEHYCQWMGIHDVTLINAIKKV